MSLTKENKKEVLLFAGVFLLTLFGHATIVPRIDDLYFASALNSYSLGDFLAMRYETWSSRLLIEACLVLVARANIWVWRILDSVIYTAIVFLFTRFVSDGTRYGVGLAAAAFLAWPFAYMDSAGYIATTMNYTWVLFGVLTSILLITNAMKGKKISPALWVLGLLPALYAGSSEQGAACLAGFYVLAIVWCVLFQVRIPKMLFVYFAADIACLLVIATCPGNSARIAAETEGFLAGFAGLSLVRKLELGFSSTLHYLLFEQRSLMLPAFTLALALAAAPMARNEGESVVTRLPFVLSLLFVVFADVTYRLVPVLTYVRDTQTKLGTLYRGYVNSYLTYAVYFLLAGCILYSIFMICREDKKRAVFVFFCVALGFATRLMMGFSASIWASVDRTFLFLFTALMAAAVVLLQLVKSRRARIAYLTVCVSLALLSWLSFVVNAANGLKSFS